MATGWVALLALLGATMVVAETAGRRFPTMWEEMGMESPTRTTHKEFQKANKAADGTGYCDTSLRIAGTASGASALGTIWWSAVGSQYGVSEYVNSDGQILYTNNGLTVYSGRQNQHTDSTEDNGDTPGQTTTEDYKMYAGEDGYGPFEAGFSCDASDTTTTQCAAIAKLCQGGTGTETSDTNCITAGTCDCANHPNLCELTAGFDTLSAEQQLGFQCGKQIPSFYDEDGDGDYDQYLSLLDYSCGGHTNDYHIHEKAWCLYDRTAEGHSTLIGYASDGQFIYGEYESTGTAASTDVCNGHFGFTWESQGFVVYHYHSSAIAPFFVGCFGPDLSGAADDHGVVSANGLVSTEKCRDVTTKCGSGANAASSFSFTDTDTGTVTTKDYDAYCSCFDASGDNTRDWSNTNEWPEFASPSKGKDDMTWGCALVVTENCESEQGGDLAITRTAATTPKHQLMCDMDSDGTFELYDLEAQPSNETGLCSKWLNGVCYEMIADESSATCTTSFGDACTAWQCDYSEDGGTVSTASECSTNCWEEIDVNLKCYGSSESTCTGDWSDGESCYQATVDSALKCKAECSSKEYPYAAFWDASADGTKVASSYCRCYDDCTSTSSTGASYPNTVYEAEASCMGVCYETYTTNVNCYGNRDDGVDDNYDDILTGNPTEAECQEYCYLGVYAYMAYYPEPNGQTGKSWCRCYNQCPSSWWKTNGVNYPNTVSVMCEAFLLEVQSEIEITSKKSAAKTASATDNVTATFTESTAVTYTNSMNDQDSQNFIAAVAAHLGIDVSNITITAYSQSGTVVTITYVINATEENVDSIEAAVSASESFYTSVFAELASFSTTNNKFKKHSGAQNVMTEKGEVQKRAGGAAGKGRQNRYRRIGGSGGGSRAPPPRASSDDDGLAAGAVAGVAVGSAVIGAAIAAVVMKMTGKRGQVSTPSGADDTKAVAMAL